VRGWYRRASWILQVSHGFLSEPEASQPGDVRRTTVSATWTTRRGGGFTAATVAYGRNDKFLGDDSGFLAEITHRAGDLSLYGRAEEQQVESDLLRFGTHNLKDSHGGGRHPQDRVEEFTAGGVRDLARVRGFEIGAGGDLTLYHVPSPLVPYYGSHPASFHIFVRVRPPAPMGRMTDIVMTRGGM
jgi:hypothetical protein